MITDRPIANLFLMSLVQLPSLVKIEPRYTNDSTSSETSPLRLIFVFISLVSDTIGGIDVRDSRISPVDKVGQSFTPLHRLAQLTRSVTLQAERVSQFVVVRLVSFVFYFIFITSLNNLLDPFYQDRFYLGPFLPGPFLLDPFYRDPFYPDRFYRLPAYRVNAYCCIIHLPGPFLPGPFLPAPGL